MNSEIANNDKTGPAEQRRSALRSLKEQPLDVLVIGGGIVGSGIARDAAMRGLRVGLVEQHDFAFGTSSRSSRLLHGGLRYLAQGHVGLVREASVEKKVILEEIGMYEDRPQWRLQDFLLERYFGKHPLGFRVLGTLASIGAMRFCCSGLRAFQASLIRLEITGSILNFMPHSPPLPRTGQVDGMYCIT